jgi:hypothetical protein
MATHDVTGDTSTGTRRTAPRGDGASDERRVPEVHRRKSTETKASFKTTEFMSYVGVLVAILIAGLVVDSTDAGGLGAKQVWLYATILTVGYMVSRGLAKAGSRDPYDD